VIDVPADTLRAIAARLDAASSIARRSGGALGTAAAYLPGERIEGVRVLDDGRLEVHVVMRWGHTVDDVEREVLAAVGGRSVDVVIDDLEITHNDSSAR
jgi:hypothetical protein